LEKRVPKRQGYRPDYKKVEVKTSSKEDSDDLDTKSSSSDDAVNRLEKEGVQAPL
jgi:hypothetical protein